MIDVLRSDDEYDAYRSKIPGFYGIIMAVDMLVKPEVAPEHI